MLQPNPHEIWRVFKLALGVGLIIAAPVLSILPGPVGILCTVVGLVLVLRNARWARRTFIRLKRRFPRWGKRAHRMLRPGGLLRWMWRENLKLERRWTPLGWGLRILLRRFS
jgi:hypothetical protein